MTALKFCTPKQLPPELHVEAARKAIEINPANRPHPLAVNALADTQPLTPGRLALITSRWWGAAGVHLTVSFMENTPSDLQQRILQHMNAWASWCNASFSLVGSGGQVRITLAADGYWSYVGTDVASISAGEPTMSLQAFSMSTPESEYHRVVRHETGHTLGFPHEHQRAEIIALLDRARTIAYGERTWGWDEATIVQQVLTPLPVNDLTQGPVDQQSIMCYQLPGECTLSGQDIPGGLDIDSTDGAFANSVYPGSVNPPPPPPGGSKVVGTLKTGSQVRAGTQTWKTAGGVKVTEKYTAALHSNVTYQIVDPTAGSAEPAEGVATDSFDAVMAALEARFANRPFIEAAIRTVQALGDLYLSGR